MEEAAIDRPPETTWIIGDWFALEQQNVGKLPPPSFAWGRSNRAVKARFGRGRIAEVEWSAARCPLPQ